MPDKKEKDYYDYYSEDMSQQANATQQYYDMAEQQRYTDLLNSKIESENAKNMALKYSQQQLANQGFASQGYGSSINAGYYNTYANQLAQAQSDYNFDMNTMRLEEQQALNNIMSQDKAIQQTNMNNMINSANSINQLNKIYSEYGYGYVDENTGEFIWNEKPSNMSNSEWTNLKLSYTIKEDNLSTPQKATYTIENISSAIYRDSNGELRNIGEDFEDELKDVIYNQSQGKYKNGDVITLTSKKGRRVTLKYNNGTFEIIDEEDNESTSNSKNIDEGKLMSRNDFVSKYRTEYSASIDQFERDWESGKYKEGETYELKSNNGQKTLFIVFENGKYKIVNQ